MTALRPVVVADVAVLERQHTGPDAAGEMSWFGFKEPGSLARRVAAHETLTDDRGLLAVVDDDGPVEGPVDGTAGGTVVGDVSWIRVFNGPPPNGNCWNVGIWIVPEHRGKGFGSDAQRLVAAYLFEHTYAERVEAGTESENVVEQRALEKAGFTREGVLRRACFRGGAWRDMVVYSKLRGEP
jgi:RimJ/RimL family protein N-acetyltransferase